jgi:cellulose synthase/poly-beta-1,6-N-acetylglucosamine synthase-like glycosyltransferase
VETRSVGNRVYLVSQSETICASKLGLTSAASTADEAIESVLPGTFRELEMVAVDDGSTDDTVERLAAWQGRNRRVKLVRRSRNGVIPALNTGLEESQAQLVARMDGGRHLSARAPGESGRAA